MAKKLGDLLVEKNLISPEQLAWSLKYQAQQQARLPLGRICIQQGWISPEGLQKVLRENHKSMYLGELLVTLGLVSQEHIDQVLKRQSLEKKRLGVLLIESQLISEQQLVNALSIQLDIPHMLPSPEILNPQLLQSLPTAFMLQNLCIPLFQEGNTLTVVLNDPLNQELLSDLQRRFQHHIAPAIATKESILNALNSLQNKQDENVVVRTDNLEHDGQVDQIRAMAHFILSNAIMEKARAIHIEPQERYLRIRFRVGSILYHKTDLPANTAPTLIPYLKKNIANEQPVQAHILGEDCKLQIESLNSQWGEKLVIHLSEKQGELLNIDNLGFNAFHLKRLRHILDQPGGMVIWASPPRSGVTSSLYALMNYLNDLDKSLLTLERHVSQPIPGIIQGIWSDNWQKKVAMMDCDILFASDPDPQAWQGLFELSSQGVKVLANIQSPHALSALYQLLYAGHPPYLMASNIHALISQRLGRKLCQECKSESPPSDESFLRLGLTPPEVNLYTFFEPSGCKYCNFQGYTGTVALQETLLMTSHLQNAIMEKHPIGQLRQSLRQEQSLISFVEDGLFKAMQGVISLGEVLRVCTPDVGDQSAPRTPEEIFALCQGSRD